MTHRIEPAWYASTYHDVVVLPWPGSESERERLERAGTPRLLLIEPGVEPPVSESCLEDWLRLPADDADVRARVVALSRRAAHHPMVPAVGEHGRLTYRGNTVYLSPVEERLAVTLVANYGQGVADDVLFHHAWPDGGGDQVLRVHISRLRKRIAPLGLGVGCIRGFGYVLREE